jgi:drug/metabolite transporter (DMT)-like permease
MDNPGHAAKPDSILAVSLLLGCTCSWGLQQVLIKATIRETPPIFRARCG